MSIRLQVLDYAYVSGDNMVDVNQASSGLSSGWSAGSPTYVAWDGSGSGITYLSNISSQSLIVGRTYSLSYKVIAYSGSGTMGFSSSSGVPNTARFSSPVNGIQYFTFVATGTSFPDLFGRSTNTGTMSHISITELNILDWEKSVVGELDVTSHEDFPLALTFSISDIRKMDSRSGSFSKTFKIPATKNNNQLLKSLYIENVISGNNVLSKKQCRIMVDNLYGLNGFLKITAVGKTDKPSYYSCVFYGENLGWASALDEKYIYQLKWGTDGENLGLNKPSIMDTWSDTDCTSSPSPVVYPIVSYGEYNAGGNVGAIQLLQTYLDQFGYPSGTYGYYGFNDYGTDYGTPEPQLDWRPTVWVRDTIYKIFNSINYSISSSFMDSDMFKRLVWALPNAKYNNSDERYADYLFKGKFNDGGLADTVTLNTNSSGTWGYDREPVNLSASGSDFYISSDNSSSWDSASGELEIKEYGYYTISLDNFGAWVGNGTHGSTTFTFDFIRLQVQLKTVGTNNWQVFSSSEYNTDFTISSSSPDHTLSFTNSSIKRYFNNGDKIRLSIYTKVKDTMSGTQTFDVAVFGSSSVTSSTQSTSANGVFMSELDSEPMEYGQTYNLKDVINKDYKQMDFIKGISHAFNLQFTTDESTKTVSIEPFNEFYLPLGDAIDYTYKLDRSKEITDKFLETDIKRDLILKYKSDGKDGKVKARSDLWWRELGDEYPYLETLSDEFKKGESKFENPFFAGTYNAKDQATTGEYGWIDTAYSAILWEANHPISSATSRGAKGYEYEPRLLYWNKYSPATSLEGTKWALVQTWSGGHSSIHADSSIIPNSIAISDIYPQATSYNPDKLNSPNLCYGNVWVRDYDDATGIYETATAHKGLYETYYAGQVGILKQKPRIRIVYLDLKITDIVNLDFRKLIYIDGTYWRINKIMDYKPHQNISTKVELLEWIQIGDILATNPSTGTGVITYDPADDNSNDNMGL